jgi:hypothetical protein
LLLEQVHQAFNARDIEGALNHMRSDVVWANGMEGGNVLGHVGVRDYWTRQWRLIDPHVEPIRFQSEGRRVVVDVHAVVRDMEGIETLDQMVKHIFTLDNGLVAKFEIG